jgi:hypothetical protein
MDGYRGEGDVKSHYSFPPSSEIKKMWSYTSFPPYVFRAWFLFKYRDKFTFTFSFYGNIDLIFSWMFVLFHVGIYFYIYMTFVLTVTSLLFHFTVYSTCTQVCQQRWINMYHIPMSVPFYFLLILCLLNLSRRVCCQPSFPWIFKF